MGWRGVEGVEAEGVEVQGGEKEGSSCDSREGGLDLVAVVL
jgi:hypothetical protein